MIKNPWMPLQWTDEDGKVKYSHRVNEETGKVEFNERDYKLMGLPPRLRKAEFEKIPNENLKVRIGRYVSNLRRMRFDGVGIFMCGDNGIGKSMAASYVLRAFYAHGQSALFVTAYDLMRSSMNDMRHSDDYSLWEYIHRADVLLLDELGSEFSTKTGFDLTTLNSVIRNRYHDKKVTLITSNWSLARFKKSYKKSTYNIIDASSLMWEISGDDIRSTEVDDTKKIVTGD